MDNPVSHRNLHPTAKKETRQTKCPQDHLPSFFVPRRLHLAYLVDKGGPKDGDEVIIARVTGCRVGGTLRGQHLDRQTIQEKGQSPGHWDCSHSLNTHLLDSDEISERSLGNER